MPVSSLYQVERTINTYNTIAYNWGDSSHPETYQSFATTGKGLIDQSIFPFQRRKDAWSLGAYCTSLAKGADASQITMEKHQSTLSKNNAFVINNTVGSRNQYGEEINDSFRYSPNPTMGGWSPWINFEYTKTRIYPTFYMIDPAGVTYGPWNYNQVVENNATTWKCWACFYELTGSVDITTFNIMNCQYAGQVREQIITDYGWNLYDVTLGNIEEGVYYYINGGNQLFQGPTFMIDNNRHGGDPRTRTLTAFFDFTQMEYEMVRMSAQSAYQFAISFADVVKMIESLGFYWCKDRDALSSPGGINCTDPDLVCPIIDPETHMVTEEVLAGSEISAYAIEHQDDPFCNYLLDSGNTDEQGNPIGYTTEEYRSNYNPEQTTIEPADEIDLNYPAISTTGGTSLWLLTGSEIETFFTTLWDPDGDRVQDIIQGIFLFGENPMDSVISCRFYPLNLDSLVTRQTRSLIFGRYDTGLDYRNITSSNVIILDVGSFTFNDGVLYNDFRDYEPYTKYSLYIPFCGIVPLSAFECIGTVLSIKMIIDINTGACTSVVYTNDVPYKYIDGMIGIDMPVTGRDMSAYAQTVMGAALAGGAVGGKAASGAIKSGNASKAQDWLQTRSGVNAMGARESMAYGDAQNGMMMAGLSNVQAAGAVAMSPAVLGLSSVVAGAAIGGTIAALSNAPAVENAGSNAPAMGLAKPLYPYFIVQRSECWIPENYNKLYGRPLNEGGKVSDFSGFSTFGNLKLEGFSTATPEEKLLINSLLQAGIYI